MPDQFVPITPYFTEFDNNELSKQVLIEEHNKTKAIEADRGVYFDKLKDNINLELKRQYEAEKSLKNDISIWSVAWFLVTNAPSILKLLYKLYEVFDMDADKKTTVMATAKVICGIIALALSMFNIDLPMDIQEAIVGLAGSGYLVLSWIQGLFTNKQIGAEK